MIFKKIINNLFSMSSYEKSKNDRLIDAVIYSLKLSLMCGGIVSLVLFFIMKPLIEDRVDYIYNSIPDFKLNGEGLTLLENGPVELNIGNKKIYIDTNKSFLDLVVKYRLPDKEDGLLIGNDGFGKVKGRILNEATFFSSVEVLEGIQVSKADLDFLYKEIKSINNSILLYTLLTMVAVIVFLYFLRSFMYSIIIKSLTKIKGNYITLKDSFKLSLYGHTFFGIYCFIIVASPMNISIFGRLMLTEIISLIYVITIFLRLNKNKEK